MKCRRALHCFYAVVLHLLLSSGPNAAQTQGDIPIVNPTTQGGGVTTTPTTTPTINPQSPPAPPQTGPITTPTFGGTAPTGGSGQWCIASPSASQTALQVALDYACGYGGADCSMIQQGSGCYEPNTLRDHASFAFNDYYQKHPGPTSCVFGGTAQLTNTDPSSGNCHYTPASGSTSMSPPSPPSPTDFTTPTITTPTTTPTTTMPGGGPTVYGVEEPTGEPSSANSPSHKLILMFAAAGMLMPLLRGNYH